MSTKPYPLGGDSLLLGFILEASRRSVTGLLWLLFWSTGDLLYAESDCLQIPKTTTLSFVRQKKKLNIPVTNRAVTDSRLRGWGWAFNSVRYPRPLVGKPIRVFVVARTLCPTVHIISGCDQGRRSRMSAGGRLSATWATIAATRRSQILRLVPLQKKIVAAYWITSGQIWIPFKYLFFSFGVKRPILVHFIPHIPVQVVAVVSQLSDLFQYSGHTASTAQTLWKFHKKNFSPTKIGYNNVINLIYSRKLKQTLCQSIVQLDLFEGAQRQQLDQSFSARINKL